MVLETEEGLPGEPEAEAEGVDQTRFWGRAGRISARLRWAPSRVPRRSRIVCATSSAVSIQDASPRGAPPKVVSTEPGAIVVTFTPCCRTSSIKQAARWSRAALLAQ